MTCDNCNKPATVHVVEIQNGKKIEKHMCEQCAAKLGALPTKGHTPINELLTNFVLQHAGNVHEEPVACDQCGLTWGEFRQQGLLGCAHDYEIYEALLTPLVQRAHEGATHHIGKAPKRVGAGPDAQNRQAILARLRKDLLRCVEGEDYETAARLRDQIRDLEQKQDTTAS